ncbi:signal peptidase II [Alteribacillus sp. HJP-4]|uniref:signal peptidase II n=1 Tax=Alteribacillus sp. HJP-4 TaxID=2775394 RepID=UPI0035CCDD8C
MIIILYYAAAAIIIGLDQFTKWLVVRHMELGESIEIIPGFFFLTSHRNQGAAFGILQGQMWLFYIVTTVVIIAILYHLHKYGKESRLIGIPLALILGGAIGNFIDRLFLGEVVDFANTYIFGYDFPIFNVADSALTIGVIGLILKMLVDEWKEKRKKIA